MGLSNHDVAPEKDANRNAFSRLSEFLKHNWVSIVSALISAIIPLCGVIYHNGQVIAKLEERVDTNRTLIDNAIIDNKDELDELKKDIDSLDMRINSIDDKLDDLRYTLGKTEGALSVIGLKDEGEVAELVKGLSYQKNADVYYAEPLLMDGYVATGLDNTRYSAAEIQNHMFIMAYKEGNQDVFFQGTINENNMWDGRCLINVYQAGMLMIATEAVYENGTRQEYEQLFPNNGDWVYSKRTDYDGINSGDTWIYKNDVSVLQTILFDKPSADDMIYPSDITGSTYGVPLMSHYHGNTSNGKYNDDTGEAYLIEYYEDGYVRLLYSGQFIDGLPNDSSGEAWQIARDKIRNTSYMLYQGTFVDGNQIQNPKEAIYCENPITKDTLIAYTIGKEYETELNWDFEFIN